jgi:hypothetical protein
MILLMILLKKYDSVDDSVEKYDSADDSEK